MFYSLNSIFFQREVYPATDFQAVTKHGLTVWMAQDQELRKYLDTVLEQMKTWIEVKSLFIAGNKYFCIGWEFKRGRIGYSKC